MSETSEVNSVFFRRLVEQGDILRELAVELIEFAILNTVTLSAYQFHSLPGSAGVEAVELVNKIAECGNRAPEAVAEFMLSICYHPSQRVRDLAENYLRDSVDAPATELVTCARVGQSGAKEGPNDGRELAYIKQKFFGTDPEADHRVVTAIIFSPYVHQNEYTWKVAAELLCWPEHRELAAEMLVKVAETSTNKQQLAFARGVQELAAVRTMVAGYGDPTNACDNPVTVSTTYPLGEPRSEVRITLEHVDSGGDACVKPVQTEELLPPLGGEPGITGAQGDRLRGHPDRSAGWRSTLRQCNVLGFGTSQSPRGHPHHARRNPGHKQSQ